MLPAGFSSGAEELLVAAWPWRPLKGFGEPLWFSKALTARPERSWLPTTGPPLTSQKGDELGKL